jgi:GDP/UDP-N,N'-diacetylbacillosamine 2-epimerase (hydrolysing)
MGIELRGLADAFSNISLDMLVLLGDRYEIQMAAVAAVIYRIPIAHIHGGELTEGIMDDAIRHSITKMSEIHFTSTQTYANRVIHMGEQPQNVFCVGALGTENIKNLELYSRAQLCEKFGEIFENPYVMVTYHPVTLEEHTAAEQFENLLKVVSCHDEYHYIFTYANADPDGMIINKRIEEYVSSNKNVAAFVSALSYCEFVLGNSSSGIIEAPSFHVPTINIGDRQLGRVKAQTVIDCGYSVKEIECAFQKAANRDFLALCKRYPNPYEGNHVAETIVDRIKVFLEGYTGKKKKFYDMESEK